MSDEQAQAGAEPEAAEGYSKEERTAWAHGLKAGQKARNEHILSDIVESINELKASIKSGDFGALDVKKIVDHLSVLAFLPWRKTIKARMVFQAQVKVLEMLGRYMGMFVDRLEVEEKTDLATQLKEALTRVSRICQPPREKASRN